MSLSTASSLTTVPPTMSRKCTRLVNSLRGASSPDVVKRLAEQGVEVVNRKPEEFASLIKRELKTA